MPKIDFKDKKLLYYLSTDARLSDSQLSQKIGLSKNAVKYRINRLQQEGIIQSFSTIVNIGAIGYETIDLFLKFNEDIYEHPEIIDYFKNHTFANWAITLSGKWDIYAEFVCQKSLDSFQELIQEITSHFGAQLNSYEVLISNEILRVEHLVADFYSDLKMEPLPLQKRTPKIYEIDATDAKILNALNEDSRQPLLALARKLNLTLDIVRYRVKNMLQKMVIIKFFPHLSLPKLGYTEYLYTLKIRPGEKDILIALKKKIQLNESITYAFFDIHSSSLVFTCAFKQPDEMDQFSRTLRKEFHQIIADEDYFLMKDLIVLNWLPKGIIGLKEK